MKPSSFNIGRKGLPPSQPVSNLNMYHLQGLMLLLVMDVGFENISTVLGKYNVFRVVPRLYGCVYKIL